MVEQTGIQSSFDEHEVKLYLEQVTNEVYCSFTDLIQYFLTQIPLGMSQRSQ